LEWLVLCSCGKSFSAVFTQTAISAASIVKAGESTWKGKQD
jgi:hypothetical protein